MSLSKGQIINNYKIGRELGAGAFGTVYYCSKISNKHIPLVIKAINLGNDLENDETLSINIETKVLRSLSHKHVLKYHESFFKDNKIFIVTELCRLGDLDTFIRKQLQRGYVNNVSDRLRIGIWMNQMINALAYLHHKSILHRDIKTKNIFLRNSKIQEVTHTDLPDLVLGDFGVAKILNDATANKMASTFIGTPFYMSPEQLEQKPYSKSSDVWALGCIFYELIELKRAMEARTLIQCLWQATNGPTPKFSNEDFLDWQDVLNAMLQKNHHFRVTTDELSKRFDYYGEEEKKLLEKAAVRSNPRSPVSNSVSVSSNGSPSFENHNDQDETFIPKPDEKSLTPKEKMELKRRQEADKRAREVSDATFARRSEIKKYSDSGRTQILGANSGSPGLIFSEEIESGQKNKQSHRQIKSAAAGSRKQRPIYNKSISMYDKNSHTMHEDYGVRHYSDNYHGGVNSDSDDGSYFEEEDVDEPDYCESDHESVETYFWGCFFV